MPDEEASRLAFFGLFGLPPRGQEERNGVPPVRELARSGAVENEHLDILPAAPPLTSLASVLLGRSAFFSDITQL